MSWFPDSNWLKALEIRGSTAAAVAAASILVFVMAEAGWFHLDTLPAWLKAIIAAVAVLALALVGGNVAQWFIDESSKKKERRREEEEHRAEQHKKEEAQAQYRRQALGYLDTLSGLEREIFSYLVQKTQQSFTTDMSGTRIGTLLQKGLVEMGSGVHGALDWPFTIPNFVWEELQRRKDEFNTANLNDPHPWRDRLW